MPLLTLGGGGGGSSSNSSANHGPSTGNTPLANNSPLPPGNAPPDVDVLGEHIDINVGASSWTEDVTSYFSDSDGTIESYRATLDNGQPLPSWLLFDTTTGLFRGTPLIGDVGDLSVRVYATDDEGAETSSSSWLTITITDPNSLSTNRAPVLINPVEDVLIDKQSRPSNADSQERMYRSEISNTIYLDELFTLSIAHHFTDPDDDILTYRSNVSEEDWHQGPATEWLTFNPDTGVFSGTPTIDSVGFMNIQVIANDGEFDALSNVFNIYLIDPPPPVNLNNAPTLYIPTKDTTMERGANWSEDVSSHFRDSDGYIVSYRAIMSSGHALPSWISIDHATGIFTGTVPIDYNSIANIRIWATDNDGAETVSSSWLIKTITDPIVLAGNDVIYGYGGDDTLFGGSGNDVIYGGGIAQYAYPPLLLILIFS